MHDRGLILGDLKGVGFWVCSHHPACSSLNPKVNILVDNNGHAYLAGFSLLAAVSDLPTIISSTVESGMARWMSPERLSPKEFGLEDGRPTRESDCYALGMTIYEVLSGEVPFAQEDIEVIVAFKVLHGKRPNRPQGTQGGWFTDGLWETLELCWKRQPGDRPGLDTVLRKLQGATQQMRLPPGLCEDVEAGSNDQSDPTTSDSSMPSLFYPRLIVDYPCGIIEPRITRDDNGLPSPSKTGSREEERIVTRLTRSILRIRKVTTTKLCGL